MSRAAAQRMAARRGSGSNQTKMDELGRWTIAKNLLCDTGNHFFSYLRPPPNPRLWQLSLSLSRRVSEGQLQNIMIDFKPLLYFFPRMQECNRKKKKNIQGWSLVALEPDRRYFYFFFPGCARIFRAARLSAKKHEATCPPRFVLTREKICSPLAHGVVQNDLP